MSGFTVPAVEMLGVAAIQPLHPLRQVGVRDANDEVVVGRHEDEGMAGPVMPSDHVVDELEEVTAVNVIAKYRRASHSPRRDVIRAAGDLEARGTRHTGQARAEVSTPRPHRV